MKDDRDEDVRLVGPVGGFVIGLAVAMVIWGLLAWWLL